MTAERPEPTPAEARLYLLAVAAVVVGAFNVGPQPWWVLAWLAGGIGFFTVHARVVGRVTGYHAWSLVLPRLRPDPRYVRTARILAFLPFRPSWWAAVLRAAKP